DGPRREANREAEAVLVHLCGGAACHHRFAAKLIAAIAELQAALFDLPVEFTRLGKVVLDLEKVREIGARLDADVEVDGLLVVIGEHQPLAEALADGALPDNREVRVDV